MIELLHEYSTLWFLVGYAIGLLLAFVVPSIFVPVAEFIVNKLKPDDER
jgi:hypothetical protein